MPNSPHPVFLLASVFLLALPVTAAAQNTICGRVTEEDAVTPVPGVNITVSHKGSRTVKAFAFTGEDGTFSLQVPEGSDTLIVTATGFHIMQQVRHVPPGSHTVDFLVKYAELSIREVKVKSSPVERGSDTLTYYVEQFRDATDRSIGDVLEKLPGIEVSKGGTIKYNGKPINKLYIEGLDMLDGRYGIATNNI